MKSKKEFLDCYNEISKDDSELEDRQKSLTKQKNLGWLKHILVGLAFIIVAGLVSLIDFGGSGFFDSPAKFVIILFVSLLLILSVYVIVPSYKKYRVFKVINERYKEKLISFLMENKTYTFNKDVYIEKSVFSESKLYGYFNRYDGEDLTTLLVPSKHGDFLVKMSDLTVEKVTQHKNGSSTTTIFKGVFGYITLAKSYDFELSVNQKCGREKVGLESIEFNKKYKIYSNDQILSRMILTPDKMERFLKYQNEVKINFENNKIYFGVSKAKLFNPEIDYKNKKVLVDDFYNDIKFISEIFEQLDEILDVLD